jgi:signal transduction histidine kinase
VTVLRGYVSMLEEGALGELPEQMRPVIPILGAKSAEMNLLIDQMLETARLEDSYIALNYERVELHDVVKDAVGTFSREVAARFKVVLQAGLAGVAVRGDRARLVTVVSNLLDNAAKYSPPTSEVRCVLTADRGRAAVVISDYGVGIAATDMPALFTRFGRIVTPENSHIQGTGLGLYLARELARAHGGDVTATSRLGVGSVFMFTLPVAEAG